MTSTFVTGVHDWRSVKERMTESTTKHLDPSNTPGRQSNALTTIRKVRQISALYQPKYIYRLFMVFQLACNSPISSTEHRVAASKTSFSQRAPASTKSRSSYCQHFGVIQGGSRRFVLSALPKTHRVDSVNMTTGDQANIGLVGLAVMGQNLALNVAEKGFKISVYNRSAEKTDACVARAVKEGLGNNLQGFKDIKDFVMSLERPRRVIILVKAGAPVDATIASLSEYMEEGDIIIDGGNEWYENTERRQSALKDKGIIEIGMGVSGGEEGARRGPAMMPGGDADAYKYLAPIVEKVAAQTDDGACVTYIGPGGSGNFVKMVHNGIEYGDMQLIAEAYDLLKTVGGLSNDELAAVFDDWNKSELESFLIEITASIFKKKDEFADGFLVDKVQDKTGMKVR
jgi:6-phosphogluconate dehydrogenase (decarboxylating)